MEEFSVLVEQCLAGPECGEACVHGEGVRDREINGGRVMVPEQNYHAALPDKIEAFIRIGAISYDVAKADDLVNTPAINELKRGGQSFEVSMNIGDDGEAHVKSTNLRSHSAGFEPVTTSTSTSPGLL